MAIKYSEMCAVRTDLAVSLEAAFDNYLSEISRGYRACLTPMLAEGETVPDVELQLVLLRRKVKHHRQRIDDHDEGVLEQAQGDEKVRAEIDRRTTAVDGKLRLVRSAYRGFYGRDNLGRVGLAGEFPRGTVRLHRQAVAIKTSLMSPDFDVEPLLAVDLSEQEGQPTSMASQLAGLLDPEVIRLGQLLDERHHESGKTLDLRLKRQEVIRDFDYNVRAIVRMTQGMFRLAGRDDLARRIRPVLQRVLRKLDDQEAREQAGDDDGAGIDGPAEVDGPVEVTPEAGETETEQTSETADETAA